MSTHHDSSDSCFLPDTLTLVPTSFQAVLFTFYITIMVFSCCGNLFVIVVQIVSFRKSPKSRNICKYLSSLALSDVIHGGALMPFHYTNIVYGAWIYPRGLCPYMQFLELMSVFNTSLTLALLGIERFLVTLYPFSNVYRIIRKCNTALLINIWLAGALYAYIPFDYMATDEFEINEGEVHVQCLIKFEGNVQLGHIYMIANFVITYLIPISALSFSCWSISNELSRTCISNSYKEIPECESVARQSLTSVSSSSITSIVSIRQFMASHSLKTKTLRLLLITVLTYFICWTPVKVYQMLAHFGLVWYCSKVSYYWTLYFYIFINLLAITNSLVNPVLYSFLSNNFRINLLRSVAPLGSLNWQIKLSIKGVSSLELTEHIPSLFLSQLQL